MNNALLIIDMQNDFMPGGSLEIPGGDTIIPYINSIHDNYNTVVFTKDWHPKDHCSFNTNKGVWPVHCVQNTPGAKLHKDLFRRSESTVIKKGKDSKFDSYSAFIDDGGSFTGLYALLMEKKIESIDVVGVAMEYCVKFTVLDGLNLGLKVRLFTRGCMGIDNINDTKAIFEMDKAGAHIVFGG